MGKKPSGNNNKRIWLADDFAQALVEMGGEVRGDKFHLNGKCTRKPHGCSEYDPHLVRRLAIQLGTNRAAFVLGGGQG